jgi:superfamily II RNA helicase
MDEGHLDAIFSTSTVAAGVNFPARTVVLVQSDRFNGKEFTELTATELHQMTGRAGRRGKDNIGFALILPGPFQDPRLIDDLLSSSPEPVNSQIAVNFSMVLNLLLSHRPEEIREIFERSFATFQSVEEKRDLLSRRRHLLDRIAAGCDESACQDADTLLNLTRKREEIVRANRLLKKELKARTRNLRSKSSRGGRETDHIERQVRELEETLETLPCHTCAQFSRCHSARRGEFRLLLKEARLITSQLEAVKNRLWHTFEKHLTFLKDTGFATEEGRLTRDGIWASRLRLDQPLMIAEAIRSGLLESLSPQLMAGAIAPFVSDKTREVELNQEVSFDRRPIKKVHRLTLGSLKPLWQMKRARGFESPLFQFWPAASIYAWACGMKWEDVIRLASVDEGDMAMLIYRTADNLRQIASLNQTHPDLARTANEAVSLLFREPVLIV